MNLHRLRSATRSADLDCLIQRQHEDLAVADGTFRAGAGNVFDHLDCAVEEVVVVGAVVVRTCFGL